MRALSIQQPFAALVMIQWKKIENRTKRTLHRGQLLIHAGKAQCRVDPTDPVNVASWEQVTEATGLRPADLHYGCLLGTVDVLDCLTLDDLERLSESELAALGLDADDVADAGGPWCWILANPRRLAEPVACRGQVGLWSPKEAAGLDLDAVTVGR